MRGSAKVRIEIIYANFPFRLLELDCSFLNNPVEDESFAELDLCRTNAEILEQQLDMIPAGHCVGFIFARYLLEQSIDAAACFHIGDNGAAEIIAPNGRRKARPRTRHEMRA
jgi:hypothetical protein